MQILDLTNNKNLSYEHRESLKIICNNNIENFNDIISKIAFDVKFNKDFLFSTLFTRNTINSDIFVNFCKILFAIELIKKNKLLDKIIVSNSSIKKILSQFYPEKKIIINNKNKKMNIFLFSSIQFLRRILQLLAAKITAKKNNYKNYYDITLVDTYVLPKFYCNDRYYTGYNDYLDSENSKKIYFVPTITYTPLRNGVNLIGNIVNVYNQLRNCNRNFIIKEDYIKIKDVLYSILYPFRVKKIDLKNIYFNNIDLTSLFANELEEGSFSNLSIESWINYLFIKNISNTIKIKKFINWWENQQVDKAYNLALSKFYPKVIIEGYLGYSPRNFELHINPIQIDSISNTIPKSINVISNNIKCNMHKKNKDINFKNAPAFRYNYLFDIRRSNINNLQSILVTLPINLEDSIFILQKIIKLVKLFPEFSILIKPHPTMNKNKFSNFYNFNNIKFTSDNLFNLFKKVDLTITAMSVTAIESLYVNIPVIICETYSILDFNPIPPDLSNDLFEYNNFDQDIKQTIDILKNKLVIKNKKNHMQNFFNIPNNINVSKFFN